MRLKPLKMYIPDIEPGTFPYKVADFIDGNMENIYQSVPQLRAPVENFIGAMALGPHSAEYNAAGILALLCLAAAEAGIIISRRREDVPEMGFEQMG